jgi:hypothetical protein
MNSRFQFGVMLSLLLLLAAGALYFGQPVSAAAGGKISGVVKFEGTPPHEKPIDMSKEPTCAQIHAGNPVRTEGAVVGPGGALQNVVVYISQGLDASAAGQVAADTPSFNQKGCQYIPHVLALNPNQHFKVVNSDQTSHNIHPLPAPGGPNHEWNKSQPPGAPPFDITWAAPEMIPVKCNIHPWMHGFMAVVKGPYGTSDSSGAFTVDNVPPGSYTVTAWQETLGTQTAKVTVSAGKPAAADFIFKGK